MHDVVIENNVGQNYYGAGRNQTLYELESKGDSSYAVSAIAP